MSANWKQVFDANPTTTFVANDIFYLARSPYTATVDDFGFTYSSLIPINTKGDIFVWSTAATKLAVGSTNGQVLQVASGAATGLAWSTATYPLTTTINQLLYSSAANTVAGLATANSAQLVTNASGVPAFSGTMTNGQVVIGSTGATPTASTLTAGTGISITNAAGSITIAATGSGESWTEVTGTSATMVADNGYIASNAGLVTLTLPATCALGSVISIRGKGAGGWLVAQNAGQSIHLGSSTTTVGAGGSLASTNRYDSFDLTCITANNEFVCTGVQGILTVV